jgi:hypothetical protein
MPFVQGMSKLSSTTTTTTSQTFEPKYMPLELYRIFLYSGSSTYRTEWPCLTPLAVSVLLRMPFHLSTKMRPTGSSVYAITLYYNYCEHDLSKTQSNSRLATRFVETERQPIIDPLLHHWDHITFHKFPPNLMITIVRHIYTLLFHKQES